MRVRKLRGDILAVHVEHSDGLHPPDTGQVACFAEGEVAERDARDAPDAQAPGRRVVFRAVPDVQVVDDGAHARPKNLVRNPVAGPKVRAVERPLVAVPGAAKLQLSLVVLEHDEPSLCAGEFDGRVYHQSQEIIYKWNRAEGPEG